MAWAVWMESAGSADHHLWPWVWWCLLNMSGRIRSWYFGTYGVTSVGNWGIESVRPIAPVETDLPAISGVSAAVPLWYIKCSLPPAGRPDEVSASGVDSGKVWLTTSSP